MIVERSNGDQYQPCRHQEGDGRALRLAAQSLIGRPLGIIMSAIHRARLEGTRQPLHLDSNNEFSALASAFNELQDAQAQAKSQLEYQATPDELTKLPNRRLLQAKRPILA